MARITVQVRQEISILLAGVGLLVAAVWADRRDGTPVHSPYDEGYTGKEINPIDRLGYTVRDRRAGDLADAGLYGGPALPFLFSLHLRSRKEYPLVLLLWLETMLLTFGVSSLLKNTVGRPRPYIYNASWALEQELTRKDRAAFLSGHAANATAGAVLFAELVRRYFPGWAGLARLLAVGIAGGTAFLRVKAGKHWPTDAVAGVALGSGVAGAMMWVHPPDGRTQTPV